MVSALKTNSVEKLKTFGTKRTIKTYLLKHSNDYLSNYCTHIQVYDLIYKDKFIRIRS